MSAKKEVVIVGAGFGGLAAAEALSGAPVDVTLIDRANHHLFQPLLYQVATPLRRTPRCCIRSECGPRTNGYLRTQRPATDEVPCFFVGYLG